MLSRVTEMVSKDVQPPAAEVLKKGRRRRRRAGSRTSKRRARKSAASNGGTALGPVVSPMKCAVHAFLMRYQSALRKVPTQIPPKIHAGPPTKRVKRVSWRK